MEAETSMQWKRAPWENMEEEKEGIKKGLGVKGSRKNFNSLCSCDNLYCIESHFYIKASGEVFLNIKKNNGIFLISFEIFKMKIENK